MAIPYPGKGTTCLLGQDWKVLSFPLAETLIGALQVIIATVIMS